MEHIRVQSEGFIKLHMFWADQLQPYWAGLTSAADAILTTLEHLSLLRNNLYDSAEVRRKR